MVAHVVAIPYETIAERKTMIPMMMLPLALINHESAARKTTPATEATALNERIGVATAKEEMIPMPVPHLVEMNVGG